MRTSDKLKNIKPELSKIDQMARDKYDTHIEFVFETGSEIDEEIRKVARYMRESKGESDHRPRRYIGVYPCRLSLMKLVNGEPRYTRVEKGDTQSTILDSILTQYTRSNSNFDSNIYGRVVLELNTNYIYRLNVSKSNGVDIMYHLTRDILGAIEDINDRYEDLAHRIYNNIYIKSQSYLENMREPWFRPIDDSVGDGYLDDGYYRFNKDAVDRRKVYYQEKFMLLFDIVIAWYINHKIVQQKVMKNDIFEKMADILKLSSRMKNQRKFFFLKTLINNKFETNDGFIEILIKNLEFELMDNSSFDKKRLQYKPMYLPYYNRKDKATSKGQLYQEMNSGLLDIYETSEALNFVAECLHNDSRRLIAEGLFDIFKKKDSKAVIDLAREVDQIEVEFEFMYDRYSKSDAMDRAYDCLDTMDSRALKMKETGSVERLRILRKRLIDVIQENRDRDIKKERLTINIAYPEGYEG